MLYIICYGFFATLTIFYGLVYRHSLVVTFVGFHLLVCLGIPLFHGWREGRLQEIWQRAWRREWRKRARGLWLGISSGILLFAAVLIGTRLLLTAEVDALSIRQMLISWGLSPRFIWLFAGYITIVNSLLEEWFWRGFVLERLLISMPPMRSLLLTSLFFSIYHLILGVCLFGWAWGIAITCLVFAAGTFWGWLGLRYQSIYASWFSHMLADLGLMTALVRWIF
ncbi:CPBP family intramembrane glutamic endopeptidase [Brevibacillus massiliensis]|uniref:CPBP family intramembrane glutamic endopeptidase n=1 Tax=Brevibacillus massiliensis TaxID=1118054 RepID=UPI0002DED07E|nr:type II CAAX endopeptidase family protein [Brevibacillus massiliensis]